MNRAGPTPEVLILGTADWDAPIATNQHYVARELAARWPVTFVESMGLRRPTLSMRDARRILKRLQPATAVKSRRPVSSGVTVIRPKVLPWHCALTQSVNRALIHRLVGDWLCADGPRVLWTFTPNTYELERFSGTTVYHLVDLLHTVTGIPERGILRAERRLAGQNVQAIGSSEVVARHLHDQGFDAPLLMENVADLGPFIASVRVPAPEVPLVVFIGNITPRKLDTSLLLDLQQALGSTAQVALIGPTNLDRETSQRWLASLRAGGIAVHPPRDLAGVAEFLSRSAVGIIPYVMSPHTAGISPMKTYEYLASGLPVVSTDLPSIHAVTGAVWREPTTSDFIRQVQRLLSQAPSDAELNHRRKIASQRSWDARGNEIRDLVSRSIANPRIVQSVR